MPRWRGPAGIIKGLDHDALDQFEFRKPDDAFRAVVEAHRGLSDAQSADLDAALVFLANHIGDLDVLGEAIALAKRRLTTKAEQQQQQQQQ